MSAKSLSRIVLVMFISGFIGYIGNYFYHTHLRTPASVAKKPLLMGKSLQTIYVEFDSLSKIPKVQSEIVELTAYIQHHHSSELPIKFEWTLPEGVQLVSGQLQGEFESVKPFEKLEIKIEVRGFTNEKRNIVALEAHTKLGNKEIGNAATITSRPEDTWEYYSKDMKSMADDFKISQGQKPEKHHGIIK